MKYTPQSIPTFISRLESATSESEIQQACQEIKSAVANRWANESTRRKPMSEIRKAVRDRFPPQPVDDRTEAEFPYYFTDSGKGRVKRWEHLAIKHLSEKEYNPQTDWSNVEVKEEVEEVKPVLTADVSLEFFGLSDEELAAVNQAVGDADVKEWVKQAIMQRANAINKLRQSLDEDWETIPSETLMNDKKYRTNSGACRELVSRAVRVVKQWNYDHPDQKWCITNKLISELTGITVKAIAKAVEGMDNESYNKGQGLEPVINRLTRAAVGEPKEVMSVSKVTGIEGSEVNYPPEKAIAKRCCEAQIAS
jgi:hypothetical protein